MHHRSILTAICLICLAASAKTETLAEPDEDGVPSCCNGRVGNALYGCGDEPTIADLAAIIDAKFITGTCDGIIDCLAEADINQSGGSNPMHRFSLIRTWRT